MSTEEPNDLPALLTLLETVDGGEPIKEADALLRDIISESFERGGKGELTIKILFITSIARGTPKTEVKIEVNGKAPKLPAVSSAFFATPNGELRRDDPAQLELAEGMGKTIPIRVTSRRGSKAASKPLPEAATS